MAGSSVALEMKRDLLGGGYADSSELETDLASSEKLGAFSIMVNSQWSMQALADSPNAMPILAGSATAMNIIAQSINAMEVIAERDFATDTIVSDSVSATALISSKSAMDQYTKVLANNNRLKASVNISTSKIKKQDFLSSGTFTYSGSLAAMLTFLQGKGGDGGDQVSSTGGGGGSGGESIWDFRTSSFPSSGASVNIGATSELVGIGSAAGGNNGADGDAGAAGGASVGTNSANANLARFNDTDIVNAVWPVSESMTFASGAGGDGQANDPGDDGNAGFIGAGGAGSQVSTKAQPGTGFGSGGGGGAVGAGSSTLDAAANTGNGAPGGDDNDAPGGVGGSGRIITWYVEV